jgi:hypothetical protein
MNTTHVGKIGRLPKHIRDELGRRIEDGEPGRELVKWMNGHKYVQEILKEQFGGRPITEQNLSEWRQNGHPEWLRQEEARLVVLRLTEHSDDLEEAAEENEISARLASVLAVEFARLAMTLLEKETDPEKRWQRLCEVHRVLSRLRRDDHQGVQIGLARQRWNREVEEKDHEADQRRKQQHKDEMRSMCFAPMRNATVAEAFGGGEYGKKMAEMLHCIEYGLPLDDLLMKWTPGQPGSTPVQENPGESSLIQPNPTKISNGQPPDPGASHHGNAT